MNKIKFNNTEFEVESYNKNTYFNVENMNSAANCTLITENITAVHALAATTITSIQIYHNTTLIYDLQDIIAKIDNINEYLADNRMGININIVFTNT